MSNQKTEEHDAKAYEDQEGHGDLRTIHPINEREFAFALLSAENVSIGQNLHVKVGWRDAKTYNADLELRFLEKIRK